MMEDALKRIEAYKREEIAQRKSQRSYEAMSLLAQQAPPVRGFTKALLKQSKSGQIGLIAEIKKASPSKGLIREDFNPPELAKAYETGGAVCLSVLTDGPSFQGDDLYLQQAWQAASLPILRKDFLFDPWQVAESRALGADCILIIMAAVNDSEATAIYEEALKWNLDILVEVHNREELDRALPYHQAMLGINNRNLRTFEIDLAVFESLSKQAPGDRLLVAESGIFSPSDVSRVQASGAGAILVGESLMRQTDVVWATRHLLSGSE